MNTIFPDDCRICSQPLDTANRIPVCQACLTAPQTIEAEFWCDCCRAPFSTGYHLIDGICTVCRETDERYKLKGFDQAFSFGTYDGVLRRLIQLFKYERIETLAEPLGRFLVNGLPRDLRFNCIIPVPLHWTRKWSRGFNQAELLARVVSKHTALPVLSVLLRKRSTKAQAGLSDAERRANLDGAFQVPIPLRSKIAGKHILLIDDVLTTGTTLSAASRTLRRAGASRITVLTVARADRRSHWSLLDHVENNPAEFNQFHEVDPTESTEHGEGTLRS